MGKYMRSKCRGAAGEEVAAVEVTQVVGVRTRSRSAAATGRGVSKVAPRRKKALTPASVGAGRDGGSCYIHLRSRMLFMALPQQQPSVLTPADAAGAGHQGAALAAGLSRCSSTESAVDVGGQNRSHACRSDAAEVGGDHAPDVSASNSGSGPDRERRETTPSSQAHGELSDLESDLAGYKTTGRSLPAATSAAQPIVPPAQEIEEFFAAAEAAQAKRFASKYNFDFVRGGPLDVGRFEWTPVVSI
ncbi:cyclin-dependent kinase inhibitor 1-like [Miscanthus floridulus]|uniref:cyclin-dependent kinase inhibitor 1-like n=1 Tax=Miscanthus floridulus TaxID=154761 RepID=UPI00345A2883